MEMCSRYEKFIDDWTEGGNKMKAPDVEDKGGNVSV